MTRLCVLVGLALGCALVCSLVAACSPSADAKTRDKTRHAKTGDARYLGLTPDGRALGAAEKNSQPPYAMEFLGGESWSSIVSSASSFPKAWADSGYTMVWAFRCSGR